MLSRQEREHRIARLYAFICEYKRIYTGVSPSYKEMSEALGGTSSSCISFYLRKLEERGEISMQAGRPRTIEVVGGEWIFDG